MARIVQPGEGVELTAFEEPTFTTERREAFVMPSMKEELVAPEELSRRARDEAETILAAAQAEAETLRAQAKAAGLLAGELAGKREAFEQHRAAAGTLGALAEAIREEHVRTDAELTTYVTEVAIAIVERIFGELVDAHPEVMTHVVTQALAVLHRRETVTVHVHPSLVDVVERERDSLLGIYEDVNELLILGDETVGRGGCVLDTEMVTIDATVERAIARMRAGVLSGAGASDPGEEA